MTGYLIYHPKREISYFDNRVVHHDKTSSNQDPYIWNRSFLHTYCHITQMKPEIGHINFWVSGDTFPDFTQLFCDLIFVVEQKIQWKDRNFIARNNSIVESDEAFNDHYQWAMYQHYLKRRQRFTLKANSLKSFQPQATNGLLIDVVPFLVKIGMPLNSMRKDLRAGRGSRPLPLNAKTVGNLYDWLQQKAIIKLMGEELLAIRKKNVRLASPTPRKTAVTACVSS
jgi:hypothetical protein